MSATRHRAVGTQRLVAAPRTGPGWLVAVHAEREMEVWGDGWDISSDIEALHEEENIETFGREEPRETLRRAA